MIGYIRVSTDTQNLQNQKHKILEYAHTKKISIDEFLEIEISSKKNQRDRLIDSLFEKLNKEDTVIFTELSRLGRNMLEILNLIDRFNKAQIKLIFVNQPELSTNENNALSSLLLAIYGYFAQTEREIISERTKQGLKLAKANGKKLGRPKGSRNKNKILEPLKSDIMNLLSLNLPKTSILKIVNSKLERDVSISTLNYFIKIIKNQP